MKKAINIDRLKDFTLSLLKSIDVPASEANIIIDTLLEAELMGIDTHGFIRLPVYINRIRKNLVNAKCSYNIIKNNKSTAVIDGEDSMGQVLGMKAMDLALTKAKNYNIGAVAIKDSHHFGMASYYAMKAVDENMIGFSMGNTVPLMPAVGGAEKVIGNNPISIAIPSNKNPIVLDMALSSVSFGKLITYKERDESIPKGWATDKNGISTTDPEKAVEEGFLLPVGAHKGFSLAVMVEILTGILSNSAISKEVGSIYADEKTKTSHLVGAVDISSFLSIENFLKRIEDLSGYIKNSTRSPGTEEIFMPGEIEFNNKKENIKNGVINLDESLINKLEELQNSLGISKKLY